MSVFYIRKGKDIKLKGAAEKRVVSQPVPSKVALQPFNFRGIKPRVVVEIGQAVKVGTPLWFDKSHETVQFVSSVSGKVAAVNRGEKRVLLSVVVESDGKQEAVQFNKFARNQIPSLSSEQIIGQLMQAGVWPCLRQRPFSKIADSHTLPKSIFVHTMNTEPLAADIDLILENKEYEFQAGLDVLCRLTKGKVNLCFALSAEAKALTQAAGVEKHQFSGAHPAGNVSTHIHYVDPINKGDVVWYVEAQDVLRIGRLFLNGVFSPEQIVAITGEGIENRVYAKTVMGASIASLLEGQPKDGLRYISGSVLAGTNVGKDGFLCFYDSQVTVIPEGGKRRLLGWLTPGLDAYSFSSTFLSALKPAGEVSLDTDKKGSDRAIVFNYIYDDYMAIDVKPFFLFRSIVGGDIEEAEKLGILECDEEDFALCSFACVSKTDLGGVIRQGLDLIEKEG